jgi:hypothetical protein
MKIQLIIFLFVTLNSINSSKANDTIKPLPYYPAYPGSYWKYIECNGTTCDTIIERVSSTYIPHSYIYGYNWSQDKGYTPQYTDTVLVTFVDGEPIYRYSIIDIASQEPFGPKCYKTYPFLKETVGDTFKTHYYDPKHTYLGPYLTVREKTIDSKGDSIIFLTGYYYGNFANSSVDTIIYKKNVGLISYYSYSKDLNKRIYSKDLIDYYVNTSQNVNTIETNKELIFNLYPNPSSSYIVVQCDNGNQELKMFDLKGNLILSKFFLSQTKVDLSNLKHGVYFINIKNKSKTLIVE